MIAIHPAWIGIISTIVLALIGTVYALLMSKIGKTDETAELAKEKSMNLESRISLMEMACTQHKQDVLTTEKLKTELSEFSGGFTRTLDERFQSFKDALFRELFESGYIKPKSTKTQSTKKKA